MSAAIHNYVRQQFAQREITLIPYAAGRGIAPVLIGDGHRLLLARELTASVFPDIESRLADHQHVLEAARIHTQRASTFDSTKTPQIQDASACFDVSAVDPDCTVSSPFS
jgi:hypothetical protein